MAKRLGEILLDRGAVTVGELHTALDACHREGGRLGSHLLRYGYVSEGALLQALSEQYAVPPVTESLLLRAPAAVLALVPAEVQLRLLAVPFELRTDLLSVGMVNPRDLEAIDELSRVTGMRVHPFVACESAVRKLADTFGDEIEAPIQTGQGPREAVPSSAWDSLWLVPRASGADLAAVRMPATAAREVGLLATFPELVPVLDAGGWDGAETLDDESFRRGLRRAVHRDEIGDLLMRYAARLLSRIALFSVHKERVVGWMATGPGVVVEDVQAVQVSVDRPSLFSNLLAGSGYHLGPVPSDAANADIVRALGEPAPEALAVVPVCVKDRTVAFLLGDNPGEVGAVPVADLQMMAQRAGVAFELLILRSKI